jgi:hypothetical protein
LPPQSSTKQSFSATADGRIENYIRCNLGEKFLCVKRGMFVVCCFSEY